MKIHTIDHNYQYRMHRILNKLKTDYAEDIGQKDFGDWLWENKEILGQSVFEDMDEFAGIDDILENES